MAFCFLVLSCVCVRERGELCVCERESEKRREKATYGCMLVAFCFLVLRCVCVRERSERERERERATYG